MLLKGLGLTVEISILSLLVGMLVGVDDGADERVVDRVPDLHDHQQQGIPQVHAHELGPEDGHGALEREAHVAAEVAGGVGQVVPHAEGTGVFLFRHGVHSFRVFGKPFVFLLSYGYYTTV